MPVVALLLPLLVGAPSPSPRERIRFDAGWRFQRGPEVAATAALGPFRWEYRPTKAASLEERPSDDGDGWRAIKLGDTPIEDPGGFGIYRTTLEAPEAGQEPILRFESVDDNAAVYLNGKLLGIHRGYGTPFELPTGDAWIPGGPNRLVALIKNDGGAGGINGAVTWRERAAEAALPDEARPEFSDRDWRTVHLPHDYVVEGTFSPTEDIGHGALPKPTAWYRKTFDVAAVRKGKTVWLEFDGVFRNAEVYLNGERLGKEPSGYIGFRFDISKKLRYGGANTLAVHVDPTKNEGWWYEGGGIYRHVWLEFANPIHIAPDSLVVRSGPIYGEPGESGANVMVNWTMVNDSPPGSPEAKDVDVVHTIYGPDGKVVETFTTGGDLGAGDRVEANGEGGFDRAKLWSPESPTLYRLETRVRQNGVVIDGIDTMFGVRKIAWDKDRGFLLNDKPVELKGTCNHQDHAGVGVAVPDRLWEWRIKRLQSMGSNAYRCAHNPPAKEFLDACDRLGMLVIDETRHLGDATTAKSPRGTGFSSLSELRRMILRDRNHPSIIAWSHYNEEPIQGSEEGAAIFSAMKRVADELDGTRLSTGASDHSFERGIIGVSEVFGFNYRIFEYDAVRRRFPNLVLYGSETASAVSTRGEYANDPARAYVSAYDVNHPSWGATAESAWRAVAERPHMAGAFVWTGFDYRGEPTPYSWPNVNSHFGILDVCGFPKDSFWYYKAQWGSEPVVHLLPHWNWPGKEGQPIEVWAHTNAPVVELFLNGESLGLRDVPKYGHAEWTVPYAPGRLEARALFAGGKVVKDVVETTGAPAAIRLKTTVRELMADDEDLSPVDVEVLDAKGRVVPSADNPIAFAVTGAGEVRGVGNGDPSSHERDKGTTRRAFHGLAAVYVGAKGGAGAITLRATSPGLKPATLKLRSKPVAFPRG